MLWNIGSSGSLTGCWSVRRAWQLDCKRFTTNRGDIVSAGLSGSHSPRLMMKRLQPNCQARRTDQQPKTQFSKNQKNSPGGMQTEAISCELLHRLSKQDIWWLRPELADRKIHDSNQTSSSRLLLSRPEQPNSISALVFLSGDITASVTFE
ncbi:hypothetical protein CSKR_113079 [Clonorchis sinensis]|uniref:Uncharacterized protein n=1 Tax=Clonorchis sinensis TaxID=79923 RepID=A0A419Q9E7_CLOSI|nr:hypothetical protein CSKR_113079 [Clonorchis sinensis]